MEVSGLKMNVERFDGNNFRQWKFQIKCALRAKGIDINTGKPKDAKEIEEWKKNDGTAMFIITSAMDYRQIALIENCENAKQIMDKLESIYEQKSEFNKMLVHERFYNYKMNPSDGVAQHISKVESLAQQLKDSGETISETAIITKIISTLPSKYRSLRQAWMSLEKAQQTIHNLTARLMDEEASLTAEEENEVALMTAQERQKQSHEDAANSRHRFVCYNCNKRGHFARDCRARKPAMRNFNSTSNQDKSNMVAFHVVENACALTDCSDDVWLLDSGASVHMTYRKEFFVNLQEYDNDCNRTVKLGNQIELKVKGVGTVLIKKCLNGQWESNVLKEVLYVPELRRNLFSEGAAMRLGFVILKKDISALIYKGNDIVLTATQKSNNLYEMNFKTVISASCNAVQATEGSLRVWHERLGHLNMKEIRNMIKNGQLQCNESDIEKFVCEACMYGKQTRIPFHSSLRGELGPGDLIYSDVCGPMSESSVQGMRYFVLFKDAASSYLYVCFMRHKAEVLDHFKSFNAIVLNRFGHNVGILHSDNGTEYVNNNFKEFLNQNGIVHECTAPYTPQQNGRAERELRTIVESARTMLYGRSLPMKLWAEAVGCAVYLLNRTSSSQTPNISPIEIWSGEKPNIQHLKIFGSYGYVHIPDACRTKWEKKSQKMILVGYENQNYRMFDPDTNKVRISRDVTFDESNKVSFSKEPVTIECGESAGDVPSQPNVTSEEASSPQSQEEGDTSYESLRSGDDSDLNYEPPQTVRGAPGVSTMTLRPRVPFSYEVNLTESYEPSTYDEAIKCKESSKWLAAIEEELKAHEENNTWTIIDKTDKKAITSKWIFKIKRNKDGEIEKYKARLCARGFSQVKDIDYSETFAPTTRYDSIRMLLSLAAKYNYEIVQFDVKTAFLYGDLEEDIVMEIPKGVYAEAGKVCKLNKSLYGLKQAPRCWNIKFTSFLKSFGFVQLDSDSCVFSSHIKNERVLLILYVDDGLIFASNNDTLDIVIKSLKTAFDIKVLNLNCYVGLEIRKTEKSIHLSQTNYIEQIIKRFNMSDASACSTPVDCNIVMKSSDGEEKESVSFPYREAVGSLLFLALVSRPDISYAVNLVCRYVNNPNSNHVKAVKQIIKYLIGTRHFGIEYKGNADLVGYSDSDYASDVESRKSTTGYLFSMNNGPITWASRKQQTIALSTMEAEFMATCDATKELIWLKQFLYELGEHQNPVKLYVDNQAAIRLICNPVYHQRSKHIDVRYKFIREKVEQGTLIVEYIESSNQLADFLTKALSCQKFSINRNRVLCLISNGPN